MKNVMIPILVIMLLLLLGLYLVAFQVRQTEVAFVSRFGKPVARDIQVGLNWKWPDPIERVRRFDARMRVFEGDLIETTTKGADPIIVKPYVVWKVADALAFYNSVGTLKEAQIKLLSQINDTLNRNIGQHGFGDFVNSDPARIKIETIQQEMLADLKASVEGQYGVEIKAFGIKQFKIDEDVTAQVFSRMKAARDLRTKAIEAEGQAEALAIRTQADAISKELEAAAQARALQIKGQGDAEAAKFYKLLEAEPEFAIFLKNLEALKTMLGQRSTFMVPMDSEPFKLLQEVPSLEPRSSQ
jgi:membrane protease subunit HflC